jgi:hypothetical protein
VREVDRVVAHRFPSNLAMVKLGESDGRRHRPEVMRHGRMVHRESMVPGRAGSTSERA